jgi:hypothetical protein
MILNNLSTRPKGQAETNRFRWFSEYFSFYYHFFDNIAFIIEWETNVGAGLSPTFSILF